MLVQRDLGKMAMQETRCQLSMHVDDLSIGLTRATILELTKDLVTVASKAKFIMEEVLHLPLAAANSQVIASSKEAETAILQVLRDQIGEFAITTKILGVDHSGLCTC